MARTKLADAVGALFVAVIGSSGRCPARSIEPVGTGGRRSAGASAEGWGERPALALAKVFSPGL